MCTVCGCGDHDTPAGPPHDHDHDHPHGHDHDHDHPHDHDHGHDHGPWAGGGHDRAHDQTPALGAAHAPGVAPDRIVRIERDILARNNAHAAANRARLAEAGLFSLNLMSSPGAGKTTLLVRLIAELAGQPPVVVIEGDQQTANDAERIRATGVPAVQINTGKGCHLDAHAVGHALDELPLALGGLLVIENVGNLVCPAGFDLGETRRVVLLSVTEGEDKPLKYPDIFAFADLMLLTKSDLLPHLDFDVAACLANARRVNPRLRVMEVSARTGEGLGPLVEWVRGEAGLAAATARAFAAR